ncbi:MAG TPA: MotA/TolQ/ExbB proton channel family protein [Elusimicrobiota bacterium]|jgi:chemotaxis protein MotA|nr:MotA/TolQ/ExbB proton channel family protein [Elusimicrobiota bacterium]
MPNLTLWLGVISAGAILGWSLFQPGASRNIMDLHGLVVVLGGAAAAMLISTPAAQLFGALRAVGWVLNPGRVPSPEEIAAEIARLSRLAHAQGGLLALRDESADFAGGFLQRSIAAAAACGETASARQILELEVRRRRIARQEEANVFRTLGTLAPMFGLMGTLLGMLKVLTNMSEPTKLGPAMALALSSAFVGIGLANLFCVPMAGQVRLLSMRETQALEMLIEGVLAIAMNQPTYQVELRMGAYLDAPAAAAGKPGAGAVREPA